MAKTVFFYQGQWVENEVNLHYRKNNKINEVEIQERDVIHLLDDIESMSTIDLQNKLVLAMSSLKEKDMQLIDLRYFESLSFKEIGDILQISHGAAKIKLYRSLDKLKVLFNSI